MGKEMWGTQAVPGFPGLSERGPFWVETAQFLLWLFHEWPFQVAADALAQDAVFEMEVQAIRSLMLGTQTPLYVPINTCHFVQFCFQIIATLTGVKSRTSIFKKLGKEVMGTTSSQFLI